MHTWKKLLSSAVFRILVIVTIVVIPLNLLTLVLGNAVINEAEHQISGETEGALGMYTAQMDDAMRRMNTTLYLITREDPDFARLNIKDIGDKDEFYRQMQSVVSLGNVLADELEDNNLVDGMFAFFPDKDYFIGRGGTSLQSSAIQSLVRAQLQLFMSEGTNNWQCMQADGRVYLVFAAGYQRACYGAWISLENLGQTMGFTTTDEVRAFTNKSGKVFYSNTSNLVSLDMDADYSRYDGKSYTLARADSGRSDVCLVQMLTKSELTDSMPQAIRVLQVLSIVSILILPVILIAMQRWIGRPVNQLVDAMDRIERGEVDYRIPKRKVGSDFDHINTQFNQVMDEVSELKISVYEEQLKSRLIKLAFLSQQIQPHFILNTLNILYSYEKEEYELSQKLILCLSKYFRYVVNANTDLVRLEEELEHIKNYFNIQQARFIKTFTATVLCDEDVANCMIPPLIIQNFTENAIKHSLVPGQQVSIVVEAQKLGEDRLHICVYDTGAGIPESVLERIEEFRRTKEFRMDLGVGIQNAIDRLDVIWGEKASLEISRIQPQGTRIDIKLPMIQKGSNL